ncbi:ATP-binding protein [Sphingobacterium sp. Mn56C]|uniref:hybrid sensor histidine kinase/response regulator transcription factor n=1 Tax=Sphingobacterium sp. Mn56C TaxID=3395261 RepID=UPI003BD2EE7A
MTVSKPLRPNIYALWLPLKTAVICIIQLLVLPYANAYNLKQISNRENLSNSAVLSVYQSLNGLMLFGTCDGLNFYNGRTVEHYQPLSSAHALSGNLIENIIETVPETFWIQTYYGMNKLNRQTNTVQHFSQFDKVLFRVKDAHHTLFILQEKEGIFYFPKNGKDFKQVKLPGLDIHSVKGLFIAPDNALWILQEDGRAYSYTLTLEEGKAEPEISVKPARSFRHPAAIKNVFENQGELLFLDQSDNLYNLNSTAKNATFLTNLTALLRQNGEISSAITYRDGLFIGFKTNGLYHLKRQNKLDHSYGIEKVLIHAGVFTLYKDRYQDILWIATDGQGVYRYANDSYSIKSTLLNDLYLKMSKPIRAVYQDQERTLWLGSKGDGILRVENYEVHKNILNNNLVALNSSNSLLYDNSVYSFSKSKKNVLWIGTEEGINYYAYNTKKIHKIAFYDGDTPIKYIHDIYEQDSILWIATVGLGFVKAQLQWKGDTPTLKLIQRYTLQDKLPSANYFFSIYAENDSTLWFANRGQGAVIYHTKSNRLEPVLLQHTEADMTLNEFFSIAKDANNNYLIGTSRGLVRKDNQQHYSLYPKSAGFLHNSIHSIVDEGDDIFWLSTNRGLIAYDAAAERFRTYGRSDGLEVIEFSDGAAFKDPLSGVMLFGGINGFVSIQKNEYETQTYRPPIYCAGLSILGKEEKLDGNIQQDQHSPTLSLGYNQNFFTLTFNAIDYLHGTNYTFYYKLVAAHDEWINNGTSNQLSFTHLQPGEYTLLVKYHNGALNIDSETYTLKLKIAPPWYRSPLAYTGYFSIAILVCSLVARHFILLQRRKRSHLLQKIKEKHKEEVYESKLSFFTNIAHEFCTPLTLIYGPCTQILQQPNVDSSIVKYTRIIQHNAERLNLLIQDLIEFRRIETGYKNPTIAKLNVADLTKQIADLFTVMAEARETQFDIDIPPTLIWNTDKNFIITIVTNLLSNAFKYMQAEHAAVQIQLCCTEANSLIIRVSNTGEGIAEEDIAKIFDRYSVLANFENQDSQTMFSRNGLGLAIAHKMVELLGGEIKISSTAHAWTHFEVTLPFIASNLTNITVGNLQDSDLKKLRLENSLMTRLPQSQAAYSSQTAKPTMLIIDDEVDILWFLSDIFAPAFNIIALNNAAEVRDCLNEVLPDIILSDVKMPTIDGIALVKTIKSNPQTAHIPLILISAKHEIEEQIAGINAGAELYITKPFHVDYLKSSVSHLIHRKETLKDYFSSPRSAFDLTKGKLTHKEHKILLKKIHAIIDANIRNSDLSAKFIADNLHMSTRNLYRKINEIADTSISDMIRDSRLHIAEDLLVKSKQTIDEILFQSGFANRVTFFKAFTKKHQMTPKAYRAQNSKL